VLETKSLPLTGIVSYNSYLMMTHWFSMSIIMFLYMLSVSAYTWGGFSYWAWKI